VVDERLRFERADPGARWPLFAADLQSRRHAMARRDRVFRSRKQLHFDVAW